MLEFETNCIPTYIDDLKQITLTTLETSIIYNPCWQLALIPKIMDIKLFLESLSENEKQEIFYTLNEVYKQKKPVKEWIKTLPTGNMYTRLKKILYDYYLDMYIEDIDKNELRKHRNIGDQVVDLFVERRGF